MLIKLLNSIGLTTTRRFYEVITESEVIIKESSENSKIYYNKVIKELQLNGSLPPNCDLTIPKAKMVIHGGGKVRLVKNYKDSGEDRQVVEFDTTRPVAKEGKWSRLPHDNEILVVTYTK